MYDFDYHRPATLDEARALAAQPETKVLAGGMSLIPSLKMRLARYSGLVDLGGLEALNGIRREANNLVIRNSVTGVPAASAFVGAAGNSFGPVVNVAASGDFTAVPNANHPWANFAY